MRRELTAIFCAAIAIHAARAEHPGVSYIFPAGGQRGSHVEFRVGGFYLHGHAEFTMDGAGLHPSSEVKGTETLWFEGPMLFEPDSQKKEDYPKDHLGEVAIDGNAPLGVCHWSCRTSEGVTPSMKFVVGDVPEIVEHEIDGAPLPQSVTLPVTINGRIYPREDVDLWRFHSDKGETISCEVASRSLGYPLRAVLDITGPDGHSLEGPHKQIARGGDPLLWFIAPEAGDYQVAIHDAGFSGGQNFVYRLTLTSGPRIESIYPLGGRRGETVQVRVAGPGLESRTIPVTLANAVGDAYSEAIRIDGHTAGIVALHVDDLPELVSHGTDGAAQEIPVPAMLNGRIERPGQIDTWAVTLEKDQTLSMEILAAQLGSKLDSVLSVCDAEGKELATNDDASPGHPDSRLLFTSPKAARYQIKVRDHFASRGGPEFAYRLRITQRSASDFDLTLSTDAINVIRQNDPSADVPGSAATKRTAPKIPGLRVDLSAPSSFSKEVALEFTGLPEGVTADPVSIRAKQKFAEIHFTAPPRTPIQVARITVRGTAEIDGKRVTHEAEFPVEFGEPPSNAVRLAIVPPVPFRLVGHYIVTNDQPGGTSLKKHYQIERGGFDGPLTVSFADRQVRYLRGVTGPIVRVPAGASEFDYTVRYPADIEQGHTSRAQLMLTAELTDFDGSRHTLSYTSAENDDQIISITTAGLLQISTPESTLVAKPNGHALIPVKLQRDPSLASRPILLELRVPRHIGGVVAHPVEVPPGKENAALQIEFGPNPGPFNMPLTIVARTLGDPLSSYEAETNLEIIEARRIAN